jgi:polyhydroxyalkanoate synthesis regulator protein
MNIAIMRAFNKIVLLREEKVMFDVHLAEMYGVEIRALKQAVRRNADMFPEVMQSFA